VHNIAKEDADIPVEQRRRLLMRSDGALFERLGRLVPRAGFLGMTGCGLARGGPDADNIYRVIRAAVPHAWLNFSRTPSGVVRLEQSPALGIKEIVFDCPPDKKILAAPLEEKAEGR
jgi:hypothetical protein